MIEFEDWVTCPKCNGKLVEIRWLSDRQFVLDCESCNAVKTVVQ